MKKTILICLVFAIMLTPLFAMGAKDANFKPVEQKASQVVADPTTLEEKVSYAFGYLFVNNIKSQGVELDLNQFVNGAKSTETKPVLTMEEMQKAIEEYQKVLEEKQQEMISEISTVNKKRAQEFLAKNAQEEGVLVTPEGVQYKFETKGTGEIPKVTDTITVDYELKDLDGNVLDSSYARGEKATFKISNLIPGFQYGMQVTPVGSKVTYWITPDLGYGEKGTGNIAPNSLLIFNIELYSIEEVTE